MDAFLKYFFQDVGMIVHAIYNMIGSFFEALKYLFNFPYRAKLLKIYSPDFGTMDWIMLVLSTLVLIGLCVGIIWIVIKVCRKLFRFRIPIKKFDELKEQVKQLSRDVIKLNYEKDKILAMKISELGMTPDDTILNLNGEEEQTEGEDGEGKKEEGYVVEDRRNHFDSPPVDPMESRFFRLTTVDNFYKTQYQAPEYDNEISLEEFCNRFRLYAGSRLHLYYDIRIIRYFVSFLGTSRLLILQGISGTGKTSLA